MIDLKVGQFMKVMMSPFSGVTITAVPAWGSMPPLDFQVNQINGDVVATWTNQPTAVGTLVRAKYGSALTSITDGYQVYFGAAETCADLGVNIDDNIQTIYYSAWAINAADVWSTPVNDIFEVTKMALIIVTGALIFLGFTQRKYKYGIFLQILASLVAIAFGAYWIAEYEGFIYVIEGTVSVAIGVFLLLTAALDVISDLRGN